MADWPYNTARWKRLRARHLALHPLCMGCQELGRLTVANTVDHRKPISAGGDPFPGHDGLNSFCTGCHSEKTARGPEAGSTRSRKHRRGCNADGSPLDPQHPWHAGKSLRADAMKTDGEANSELVQLDALDDELLI